MHLCLKRMTALAQHCHPKARQSLFCQEHSHLNILHQRALPAPRSRGSSLLLPFPLRVPTRSTCPKFKMTSMSSCSIAQEEPLPITKEAACGIQEPFNSGQCFAALDQRGTYMCGFNFFWLDLLRSPSPGIPLSRRRVKELGDWMFKEGITPQEGHRCGSQQP